MKRIMTLLLAAGLVFGATGAAKAVDIKASGYWQFGFEWTNARSQVKGEQGDNFSALQRFRTQIDVIASENLKGVVFFEIGKSQWGNDAGGAALGSDGKTVKVRYAYVDWVVPQTDLKVRMGLQPFDLPSFVSGSPILADDGAGITLAYDFNENVGATLFWLRASNENSEEFGDTKHGRDGGWEHDAMDVVGLTIPVKGDGFKVTPWGMYANVGRNSLSEDFGSSLGYPASGLMPVGGADLWGPWGGLDDNGNAWWAGIGGELTLFSPFTVAAEFAYGSADFGSVTWVDGKNFDAERAGWYAALKAEYKLDMMTPGLIFWYASGDDDDPYNGSERMPTINSSNTDWGVLSLAYDGLPFARTYNVLAPDGSMTGTWGVVAQLKDISFVENLKHLLRVGYIRGTNDSEMVTGNDGFFAKYSDSSEPGGYLTEDDWAWEVDFITDYKIYEDLSLTFDVAYMRVDWDEDNWKKAGIDNLEKNYYRAGLYMKYSF